MSDTTNSDSQAGLSLDYDSLQLGDYLPVSTIERLYGVRRMDDPDRWHNNILAPLRTRIERHFKQTGKLITSHFHHFGIKICTDEEAVRYNQTRERHALRDIYRANRRQRGDMTRGLKGVDTLKLSPETRALHERGLSRTAQLITSINSLRHKESLRPDWRKNTVEKK